MRRACLLALAVAACSNTNVNYATGDFFSPASLAVVSGADRDLLFIANEGRDNLRVLQMCNMALQASGDPQKTDTCPTTEDFQFVPGPIRVFPATVEVGDRPRRLAGVRLTRADGSATGVVLAAVTESVLRIVDGRNVLDAASHKEAARPVLSLPLPAPAIDVAAANPTDTTGVDEAAPAGQTVAAFVVTGAASGVPAQLLSLQVGLDPATGAATVPAVIGQCSLGAVTPRRIATIPGGGDFVYVADGAGDGVVRVAIAGIPGPSATPAACTLDRISANQRSVHSLALSPIWFDPDDGHTHPAGEVLMMVLEPLATPRPGYDLDSGGILIARTSDKAIVPVPPYSMFDATAGLQPMEPITPPGVVQDVAIVRAMPPDPNGTCHQPPCTPLYVGVPTDQPLAKFSLMAAVTSSDGGTYFVDVPQRRFVTSSYYSGVPQGPVLEVAQQFSAANPPSLTFVSNSMTVGVTRESHWRVAWHAPFPGLQNKGGPLTDSGHGTYLLKLPVSFPLWQNDPVLQLAPGDAVSFSAYLPPPGAPQPCLDLASLEAQTPDRFEMSIHAIPAADTLELNPFTPPAGARGFTLADCPAGLGVAATVRTAGPKPWLVLDENTALGRTASGDTFVAHEQRFDYPLDYTLDNVPLASNDVAVAFTLSGTDPTTPFGAGWTFTLNPGLQPVYYRDNTTSTGYATHVISYSSPRRPFLIMTAATGQNSVVVADPKLLTSDPYGVTTYK